MKRKFILCTCIFFLLNVMVLSQESHAKDDLEQIELPAKPKISLSEIRKLIDASKNHEQNYNKALELLSEYILQNPNDFDAAQREIERVLRKRAAYAKQMQDFTETLEKEPENQEKIGQQSGRLKQIELNPTEEIATYIDNIHEVAVFRTNYNNLQRIYEETRVAIKNNDFTNVIINNLQTGLSFFLENFYDEMQNLSDGEEILNKTQEDIEFLKTQIDIYTQADNPKAKNQEQTNLHSRLYAAVSDFSAYVENSDINNALISYEYLTNIFSEYIQIRNTIYEIAEKLNGYYQHIKDENPDFYKTDGSFLPFTYRYLIGPDHTISVGMIDVLDAEWKYVFENLNNIVFEQIKTHSMEYASFLKAFLRDDFDSEIYNVSEIQKWIGLEQKIISDARNSLKNYGNTDSYKEFDEYNIYSTYIVSLTTNAENFRANLKELKDASSILQQKIQTNKDVQDYFVSVQALNKLIGVKTEQKLENTIWANEYKTYIKENSKKGIKEFDEIEKYYNNYLDNNYDFAVQKAQELWLGILDYYNNCGKDYVNDVEKNVQVARTYLNGRQKQLTSKQISEINKNVSAAFSVENQNVLTDLGILYRYPNVAVLTTEYINKQINDYQQNIDFFIKTINSNFSLYDFVSNNKKLESSKNKFIDELNAYKTQLEVFRSQIVQIKDEADNRIEQAQIAKVEAENSYNNANNAYARSNFTSARKNLEASHEKYIESLENQADESLELDIELKYSELMEKINNAENLLVVKEVRNYINLARDAYNNSRFEDAQNYLTLADNRWHITNDSDNQEIISLQDNVQIAITMKTGREISQSHPLYAEMSQLLNQANLYYEQNNYEQAIENIDKIKKVFPINKDAAILLLKIQQKQDPQKFNSELANKIQIAKNLLNSEDTKKQGYLDLKDYYEIAPDFKGLEKTIYDAEIILGIREDPAIIDLEEANKKLREAQTAYRRAGNNETQLQRALNLVNQSLEKNSSNTTAQALKDEIIIKIGSQKETFSTSDEILYNRAVALYRQNELEKAEEIIISIEKRYKNPPKKIKDLHERINNAK